MPDEGDTNTITRRDLLKAAGLGTAAIATSGFVIREHDIGEHGLETNDAIYYPIYERHDKDFDLEAIPHNVDYYFHEPPTQVNIQGADPEWQVKTSVRNWTDQQLGLISRFSQEGTDVVMGDIDISFMNNPDEFMLVQGTPSLINSVILGLSVYLGAKEIANRIAHKPSPVAETDGITRRNLLLGALRKSVKAGIITKGMALNAGTLPVYMGNDNRTGSIERILTRIDGLNSDTEPYAIGIFTRNAMMALQLMTIAKNDHTLNDQKLKVAFQVGSGHSGIEDFITAGEDFTINAICSYPKPILKYLLDRNGGIEGFCSINLVGLPNNYTPTEDRDNPPRTSEFKSTTIQNEKLKSRLTQIFADSESTTTP